MAAVSHCSCCMLQTISRWYSVSVLCGGVVALLSVSLMAWLVYHRKAVVLKCEEHALKALWRTEEGLAEDGHQRAVNRPDFVRVSLEALRGQYVAVEADLLHSELQLFQAQSQLYFPASVHQSDEVCVMVAIGLILCVPTADYKDVIGYELNPCQTGQQLMLLPLIQLRGN
ncbi:hypothetical protein NQZ68_041946 [Dissostichus eleginoides]|nr:hypothetical protein NQZ68_041946 [Dissostichus eleginoides]